MQCALIKVDLLVACIELRVVDAVLVVFLRRWRKFAQSFSQWEARADDKRNILKVPKCEIFHLFDFNEFFGVKSL